MDGTTQLKDPLPGAGRFAAATLRRHAVHGLVAIANGPDFCLCGNVWPCRPADEAERAIAA